MVRSVKDAPVIIPIDLTYTMPKPSKVFFLIYYRNQKLNQKRNQKNQNQKHQKQ